MITQAEQVLAAIRDKDPAAEAEVLVERHASALTRFANSAIHQNVADDTTTVRLRMHTGGRTVAVSTTVLDQLPELAARALAAAAVAPADPGWSGLAPPAPVAGEPGFDEATAAASPDARAAQVRALVDATSGLSAAGYCRNARVSYAFANSAGQSVTTATSEAAIDVVARHGSGADGVARRAAVALADLDGAALGAVAAAKARAGADAVELPAGRYEVVLEPAAVCDLLENLAVFGFNGRLHNEHRSFAAPGTAQLDPAVTLVDDPYRPGSPGFGFDANGTPRPRLTLVEAGVTRAVAHDRRTAAEAGADSTGHALPGAGNFGAIPTCIGLLPGTGPRASGPAGTPVAPEAAALVAGVGRGLLVTDLYYTRVLDTRTLVMTGLTRNGVWLIEDGVITAPVQNLRFTQSYPQALAAGAVRAVGAAPVVLPTEFGIGWPSAPALHLASWNFTGGASG